MITFTPYTVEALGNGHLHAVDHADLRDDHFRSVGADPGHDHLHAVDRGNVGEGSLSRRRR